MKLSARVKLGIFIGAVTAAGILVIHLILDLFRGHQRFASGGYGFRRDGWGQQTVYGFQGGFEPRHMYGPYHGEGFHLFGFLLFILIFAAIVFYFVRWFRRKTRETSMKQFIETPVNHTHIPVVSQNASILDQWE